LVSDVSYYTCDDVVQAAKAQSPSIIFIDEIDAIGGKRLMPRVNA
jgi:ATP-dependent 26S proteasome regulatory subunit